MANWVIKRGEVSLFTRKHALRIFFALFTAIVLIFGFSAPKIVLAETETVFVTNDGWSDTSVGTWDATTRTAVLTADLSYKNVQVLADDVVLDGNGHSLNGVGVDAGIVVSERNYVIVKNFYVNGFTYGIFVEYSRHVKIMNNHVESTDYGLYFNNWEDQVATGNIISHSNFDGIHARNLQSSTFADNTVSASGNGIFITSNSSSNSVVGNTVNGNNLNGIVLDSNSNSNTVDGNIVTNNNGNGIAVFAHGALNIVKNNLSSGNGGNGFVVHLASNNTLSDNTSENNTNGLRLGSFSTSNIVTKNVFRNNTHDGIYIFDSSTGNTVKGNSVSGNDIGIHISGSSDNIVYHNNFVSNDTQAVVAQDGNTSGNVFSQNLPKGGNFWSNWTSPDNNGDGIVDEPYAFAGGFDTLPWAELNGWLSPPPPPVPVDTQPPVTNIDLTGTLGNGGWYVSHVTVKLNATDNDGGSGVAVTEYSFNGIDWIEYTGSFVVKDEGETTVFYRSKDNADNIESDSTKNIRIDTVYPQVDIFMPNDGAEYLLNESVVVSWTASDSGSGLLRADGTAPDGSLLDTSTENKHSFTVTAEDEAGNVVTATYTYYVRYNFGGVKQPVNADGTSVFKFKSVISVRFQLTDANGNYVTDAVATLKAVKVGSTVSGSDAESVEAISASSGSTFKYDAENNQYVFNLSTKQLSVGTWELKITLDDGTVHTVIISIK